MHTRISRSPHRRPFLLFVLKSVVHQYPDSVSCTHSFQSLLHMLKSQVLSHIRDATSTHCYLKALAPWKVPHLYPTGMDLKLVSRGTDKSNTGLGALCKGRPAIGSWSILEQQWRINCLEMLAVLPEPFCQTWRGYHVLVCFGQHDSGSLHKPPRGRSPWTDWWNTNFICWRKCMCRADWTREWREILMKYIQCQLLIGSWLHGFWRAAMPFVHAAAQTCFNQTSLQRNGVFPKCQLNGALLVHVISGNCGYVSNRNNFLMVYC